MKSVLLLSLTMGCSKALIHQRSSILDGREWEPPTSESLPVDEPIKIKFFMPEGWTLNTEDWVGDVALNHSNRVLAESDADIVFDKGTYLNPAALDSQVMYFQNLPVRRPDRPHVVNMRGMCLTCCPNKCKDWQTCSAQKAEIKGRDGKMVDLCELGREVIQRDDIIFLATDLRDYDLNENECALPRRGVTIAANRPPRRLTDSKELLRHAEQEQRSFLTSKETDSKKFDVCFRGDAKPGAYGGAPVRQNLVAAAEKFSDPRVHIVLHDEPFTTQDKILFDECLQQSWFFLHPRGEGRHEHALTEMVGSCTIPVILADGLTLPYEQIIDWSKAAVRLPENLTNSIPDIIASLPRDMMTRMEMRKNVCEINDRYFSSAEKRFKALLLSIQRVLQN